MSDLRKILLVEDEVDLREILGLVLETEIDNVEILEVSSGNEGITFLASNQVDLIISDLLFTFGFLVIQFALSIDAAMLKLSVSSIFLSMKPYSSA